MVIGRSSESGPGERHRARAERVAGSSLQAHDGEHAALGSAPESGRVLDDFFSFDEIFRRLLATAHEELSKSTRLLFWSGLAGGLSLCLAFYARVAVTAQSGTLTPGLLGNVLYPLGFIVIVLGRYQLYTENTLTPVALVMTRLASLPNLLRLWGVVFGANMVGAAVGSALMARTGILEPAAHKVAAHLGHHAAQVAWGDLFWKAVLAGWLVASMVWLVHGVRDSVSRIAVVWLVMYMVGAGHLFHVVTSSMEVLFLVFLGELALLPLLGSFILPVLLGNTLGGIVFVASVNSAQFGHHEAGQAIRQRGQRLSWREWWTAI